MGPEVTGEGAPFSSGASGRHPSTDAEAAELRDLYDSAPCGFHSLNAEGVFLSVNEAELSWLGYSREEVVGKLRFVDLLTDASRETFAENFPRFMAQGRIGDLEFELRRKDGSTFPVLLNATAVVDEQGRFVRSRSVLFDITDRKRAQEANGMLAAIVASSPAAIIGATLDKVVTSWNPAAERIFGYGAREAVGRTLGELWLHEQDDLPRIDLAKLAEEHGTTPIETLRRRKDGRLIHISVAVSPILDSLGEITGASLIVTDITERKLTEAALAAKEAEVRARQRELDNFFQLSVDLLCIARADGHFQRLNPAWEDVLGFTQEELRSQSFIEFVHPEDREATAAVFADVLRGGRVRDFENRYRKKDGAYCWLSWSSIGFPGLQVVYAAARDVTERKRAEQLIRDQGGELRAQTEELKAQGAELRAQTEELEAQSAELRVQQRLLEERNVEIERASRLKSEFLANMSHELRTPLNAVIGFSELLIDEGRATFSPRHLKYLETVYASGRHLLELINEILDLVKIEAGRVSLSLEPLTPTELVAEASSLVEPMATKKDLRLKSDVRTARSVTGDRARLRQVLLNLLSNAIKFTPDSGSVEVGAEDAGEFVRFWVRDTGPGIPETLHPHLFQPFVQGESPLIKNYEGTGLGLSISRSLVEQHQGTITAESVLGQGAIFSFTIPVDRESPDAASRAPIEAKAGPTVAREAQASSAIRQPLVLVVDDDPHSRDLMRAWLVEAGCDVVEAATGADALRLIERLRPQLVVLDVVLPDADGLRLLERLKADEALRDIPVVIASAFDDGVRGLELGAVDFFRKPIDRKAFLRRLAEISAPERRGGAPVALLIDDDPNVATLLRPVFEEARYRLITAISGNEGLERVRRDEPDVIVVDLMLPDISGFEVVDALARDERTREIPVLVLTAADLTEADRARLRRHVRALAEKGEFTRDALLAFVRRVARGPRSGTLSGPTVLVVDDHDLNRELAVAILERRGHRVLTATDGESGVEVARRERPALILMDLAMPRKDGFEAARELKADPATATIPIVAFTAMAMKSDEERVRRAGFDGYLTKPLDRAALERAVAALVSRPRP